MWTILLVEDNEKLNEANRRVLEEEGYKVMTALTLASARENLRTTDPDVILLDVMMPDGEGYDLCEEIRDTSDAHIIFLTSRREHEEKLRGLSLGGNDYITKPFRMDELVLRVASAVMMIEKKSKKQQSPPSVLTVGSLTMDLIAQRAYVGGTDLLLQPREFALLLLFVQKKGETLNADYLYEKVWGQPLNDNKGALEQRVSQLRKNIINSGYTIYTQRGKGYCFDVED
jgi:DNA-binding response OmpR family regulator